ncbi:MAG: response regulator [Betaproteobacteria bacterium]
MVKKTFCSTREAAGLLGISVRTTQIWVEKGLLDAWKTPGGHRRVSRDSIDKLLRKVCFPVLDLPTTLPDLSLKILIVEDDIDLLKLYETTFAHWPIPPTVVVAKNGVEALMELGRELPDILIADLCMPDINGFHLVRLIKAMPEFFNMTIVVISGLDTDEIKSRGGIPENVTVFPKPVPFTALFEIIYKLWAKKMGMVNQLLSPAPIREFCSSAT